MNCWVDQKKTLKRSATAGTAAHGDSPVSAGVVEKTYRSRGVCTVTHGHAALEGEKSGRFAKRSSAEKQHRPPARNTGGNARTSECTGPSERGRLGGERGRTKSRRKPRGEAHVEMSVAPTPGRASVTDVTCTGFSRPLGGLRAKRAAGRTYSCLALPRAKSAET